MKKRWANPTLRAEIGLAISNSLKNSEKFKNRGPAWNKGLTKETDSRVLKYGLSGRGRTVPLERRLKISKTQKGRKLSEETKRRMSVTRKQMFKDGLCPLFSIRKPTDIEIRLGEILAKHSIPHSQQVIIGSKCVDFLLDSKIVVLADGCYWHGCKIHNSDLTENRNRTIKETNYLENKGYRVVRLWEHDILTWTESQFSEWIRTL